MLRNRIAFRENADLDDLRSPGAFAIKNPSDNAPDDGLWIVFVTVAKDSTRYVFQEAFSLETGETQTRYYDGAWSDWTEIGSGGGGGGGEANLSVSLTSTTVTIENDNGDDAEIPSATNTDAGVMSAEDKDRFDNLGTMAFEDNADYLLIIDAEAFYQPLDSDLTAIAALTTTAAGLSVLTVADPGADRILAWDDSANAFAAIALADITTEDGPDAGDYLLVYLADGSLAKVDWSNLPSGGGGGISELVEDTTPQLGGDLDLNGFAILGLQIDTDIQAYSANLDAWSSEDPTDYLTTAVAAAAYQPLDSDLTSIAGLSTTAAGRSVLTLTDPNADRILAWDDSAGAIVPIALADIASEGSPAAGDFLLVYLADGSLARVDWDDLPSGGGGIAPLLEDTTPQLGGDLDLNGNDINGTGNVLITGNIELDGFFTLVNGDMAVTTVNAVTVNVTDEAYDSSGWNDDLSVPTKNALRDKIESLAAANVGIAAALAIVFG